MSICVEEFIMKQIGIYYYPWYNSVRWKQHAVCYTPSIGFYDSSDDGVIDYHIDIIKRLDVDFVVIELVPIEDWNFDFILSSICKIVKKLMMCGIRHTLLIDMATGFGWPYTAKNLKKLFKIIDENKIESSVYHDDQQVYHFFGLPLEDAFGIRKQFSDRKIYFSRCIKEWNMNFYELNCYFESIKRPIVDLKKMQYNGFDVTEKDNIYKIYEENGYLPFWCATESIVTMNGYCAVIPGYDDLLLHRDPQVAPVVPRKEGQTLVEQFAIANALNADNILIYGFNEFFEGTNIEPTLEYGDFYVELTKELVRQTHAGEQIHFPRGLKPRKGEIIYLSSEVERAAQRHPDKVPRWDADWWQATVECLSPPIITEHEVRFERIRVTNTGTNAWPLASANAPIRLGARLCDVEGNVLAEGRSTLGELDVQPDAILERPVCMEIPADARFNAVCLGIVWENKFWFSEEVQLSLTANNG